MALKLNQVIALLKGAKSAHEKAITATYHGVQKAAPMSGIRKTYQPRDEEGEKLPSEGIKLQYTVQQLLDQIADPFRRLLDLTATLDSGNQQARADVMVAGIPLLRDVPVSTLLFLEKQLVDLNTLFSKLPTLDPAETWEFDEDLEAYRTVPTQTTRTKKVPRNHVKAEATDKHPAQVDVFYEDVVVGDWTTVKFSGAISLARQRELLAKVAALSAAVKVAREQANSIEVPDFKIADAVFNYLDFDGA